MKTIMDMALDAGFTERELIRAVDSITRFAALVRADERDFVMNEPITKAHWQRFENDIRADEREARAKVVGGYCITCPLSFGAEATRARGNT